MTRILIVSLGIVAAVFGASGAALAERLPLGDGKVSSAPKAGYIFSCQTRFRGHGAHRRGPWIGKDSWDPSAKPAVSGAVRWPDAKITVSIENGRRVIRANNLPNHTTGVFPISRDDEAYRFDRNPNPIQAQEIVLTLPVLPKSGATPSCVPMGMIGFALSGVAIFNALDDEGRDGPAHEIQDACDGHPQRAGQYHYHSQSRCMKYARSEAGGHGSLAGYALDGFGIYGPHGVDGRRLRSAGLDACHGHAHNVLWDGARTDIFHYHLTPDYPYTVGCFRGATSGTVTANSALQRGRGMRRGAGRPREGGPPRAGGPRRRGGGAVIGRAAQELGIDADALRRAVGPPPPDFGRAARILKLDEDRVREAMQRARRGGAN